MRRFPGSLALAYSVIGLFFVLESRLRQGDAAKSFHAREADAGTTRLIGVATGVAIVSTPVLSLFGIGRMRVPAAVGLIVMLLGLGLRIWAALVLGQFYTRTLRIASDHVLVRNGPHRWMRHPGYLGSLLLWLGFGLTATNGLAALAVSSVMVYAYGRRMQAEETMLLRSLGEPYRNYIRTTARLIPGVY